MVTTIVMFPFLFGVMFGDIFHGLLLLLLGIFLVFAKFYGAWLFLISGFFSLYCGLIYNDFNALPVSWFGKSCWATDANGYLDVEKLPKVNYSKLSTLETRFATKQKDCNYKFGIDPAWYLSESKEIAYVNSFKMKMAVILGVTHMLMGTFHRLLNFIYRRDWLSFFSIGLPQLFMMCALFGFMDLLIILKWNKDFTEYMDAGNMQAPGIIELMINMFMKGGAPIPGKADVIDTYQ
jgi:V-type H+-transporting ATPase subunit a